MRRMSLLVPVAALAAALSGCATAGPGKPALSVELFDMRTHAASAPARPFLEAPRIADAAETTGPQSAGLSEMPVVSEVLPEQAVRPPLPMRLPPLPRLETFAQSAAPVEVADTTARRVSSMVSMPRLPVPEAPAQSAVKPKPAAASTASASTAAGSTVAASAPSATAVLSAASAPSATAAAAETSARMREIYARQGDELQVGLEGQGFLFLGFGNQPGQSDGMSFKGKETRDRKSYFTFKALKFGTYDLGFLQQDNATGKSVRETVRVHVVPEAEFTAAVEGGQAPVAMGQGISPVALGAAAVGDYPYAEKLASLGAREAALAEFLKGYTEGNGYLNERIAALYFTGGDLDAAEKYYAKNLPLAGRPAENGVLGMVRVALARDDARGFLAYLKPFLAIQELSIEEQLIQAAQLELGTGGAGVGLELLAEYAKRYPQGSWRDEADWLRGQLYEANSSFRDIARARASYSDLLQAFPESAFANMARERVRYIDEHFFIIR